MSKKIESFTKSNITGFRVELEEVIKKFAEDKGLSVSFGKVKYSAQEFDMKNITISTCSESDVFDSFVSNIGASHLVGALGKTVFLSNKELVISGVNPKAPKNIFSLKHGDESYSCNLAALESGLKKAAEKGLSEVDTNEMEAVNLNGDPLTGEALKFFNFFKHKCPGIAQHLNSQVIIDGKPFKICGFNPRATKNSVTITNGRTQYVISPYELVSCIVE